MAIEFAICDPIIRQWAPSGGSRWIVVHRTNGAILAYCDTEHEAKRVRDAINDMPRVLRGVGEKVA